MLKFIAGLFWMILSVTLVVLGGTGTMMALSIGFVVIGLLFWVMIYRDFLGDKKERIFGFDDD